MVKYTDFKEEVKQNLKVILGLDHDIRSLKDTRYRCYIPAAIKMTEYHANNPEGLYVDKLLAQIHDVDPVKNGCFEQFYAREGELWLNRIGVRAENNEITNIRLLLTYQASFDLFGLAYQRAIVLKLLKFMDHMVIPEAYRKNLGAIIDHMMDDESRRLLKANGITCIQFTKNI